MTFRPQAAHLALQNNRQQQQDENWEKQYAKRAGVEGTISQAVRRCGARRNRYIGQAKTNLQQIFTAVAINLIRVDAWLKQIPLAPTRLSPFARLYAAPNSPTVSQRNRKPCTT
ncbi:hypothetical protein BAC3_01530 [uncultured bacterium]|nr:hypothetical protein BAC3_01530 [uncultured bacterium]